MLYLDYCATAPPHPDVAETVKEIMTRHFGNPSSIHRIGIEAERLLNKSREVISRALQVKPGEIIFTSGGSESNNLGIKGAALAYRHRGNHLITSEIEHASVYESFKQLERMGFRVTFLPVDSSGAVDPEEVKRSLSEDTILVSLMHVNNEVGRIQPVREVGMLLREYPRILFHVDAVQSIGKLDITPGTLGVDLLSVAAHKIQGPRGTGFLYRREGIELEPLIVGGGQEFGLRSGTESVPLLVGMAKAVRLAVDGRKENSRRMYNLRKHLTDRLATFPGLTISGSEIPVNMAPQLVHFTLEGVRAEVMVHALEEQGICISTRSACASGSVSPSRVLLAMGLDRTRSGNGLRVSYSADQTIQDMERFAVAFGQAMKRVAVT